MIARKVVFLFVLLGLSLRVAGQDEQRAFVPETFPLDPTVRQAIDEPWLTEAERRSMRVFHGVWNQQDVVSPGNAAVVALNAWDLDNPVFENPALAPEIPAEAALRRGDAHGALTILDGAESARAVRQRTRALEMLGRFDEANRVIDGLVDRLLEEKFDDAAELTEGVRALIIRARLTGRPAQYFQKMMDLLASARQELDRLYWPSILVEAELLLDKDSTREAAMALHQVLEMNPRCAEAWYELGRMAADRFDFAGARTAADSLERLNREHPLAALLRAQVSLIEDDPELALQILEPLLKRTPDMREALALQAASYALLYDEDAMQTVLDRFDQLSPGSAEAHYLVGRRLSFDRQYEWAAEILEEAIRRQPNWPTPRIELGLMELQSGRDNRALAALKDVVELDPFNKRAANSLFLLEELAEYDTIETDNFIVRYRPGIDEAMASLMPARLEAIHAVVGGRFEWEPNRKTIIEVMPDHKRFGVRITGMPAIHTIAACTGPVIAMEVPREGPPNLHLGPYDWPRVVQHEYTHTVTLALTSNRIPHWLTEAAAVLMEQAPRDYDTCRLLAHAYENDRLFTMDQINWGFIRPKRPGDRALAYAQSHWMLEYMEQRFGTSATERLLMAFDEGQRESEALPSALGISREQFHADFLDWAGDRLEEWGMRPSPTFTELTDSLREQNPEHVVAMAASKQARLDVVVKTITGQIGKPKTRRTRPLEAADWPPLVRPEVEITDPVLDGWLAEYPGHPDLLQLKLGRALSVRTEPDPDLVPLLLAYADARPVDDLPHRKLAQIGLETGDDAMAIESLDYLDAREDKTPVYAVRLAELYREAGELDLAFAKITRAVHFNPYHAPNRELAAAIAVEAGNLEWALTHIRALTLLEPDRPQHQRRLDAIENLLSSRN